MSELATTAAGPITVDAFFAAFAGVDARWELVDGCAIDASGRTLREASIIANVLTALHTRLRD